MNLWRYLTVFETENGTEGEVVNYSDSINCNNIPSIYFQRL